MLAMHILQLLSLIIVSLIWNFKNKKIQIQISILIGLIILTMLVYLTFMIIGDSDYSSHSISFWERVRLALIWPGDWLNVLITASIAIAIIPVLYGTFTNYLQDRLEAKIKW